VCLPTFRIWTPQQYVIPEHINLQNGHNLFTTWHTCRNSRCRYQSITQQYLKRCLIKDDSNYMFQSIAAIIGFSSESMVVILYRIGMVMSRWWDLNICDACYMFLLRDTGAGSVMCVILGCTAQVRLLAAVLCGSPAIVFPFRCLLLVGFLLWLVCALYPLYLWWSLCPVRYVVRVYLSSI